MSSVRCYAEGRRGSWEAVCLDLDIAVQGGSLAEVYDALDAAIEQYLSYVNTLPDADRRRLLSRKAPLNLRIKFAWYALLWSVFGGRDGTGNGKTRAEFLINAAAA